MRNEFITEFNASWKEAKELRKRALKESDPKMRKRLISLYRGSLELCEMALELVRLRDFGPAQEIEEAQGGKF